MAVIKLTKENFEETINNNDMVIVDFWATWCGPCQQFAPIFEQVSERHPNVVFAKVNTEEQQELAGHFAIRSIPTLMLFREQIGIFQQPGSMPEGALDELIAKAGELDMDDVRKEIEIQQTAEPATA